MPSSSPLDRFRGLDPEKAIDDLDLEALRACIEAGWNPEKRARQANQPSSYPLVDRVVYRGWEDGWKLLRSKWPHLLQQPELILRAFHRLQYVVLADMFEQGAIHMNRPLVANKDAASLALEGLYMSATRYAETSMGDELSCHFLEKRATQTFELLKAKGMDVYAPYPGHHHPEDDRLEGHSVWTLALYQMRWGLAHRLRPLHLDDVLRQPKMRLGMTQLMEEAFSPHQEGRKMAQTFYAWWLDAHGPWWFEQPDVLPPMARSQWAFLLALSPKARRTVWDAWGRQQADGMTWLHLVALDAGVREVAVVMEQVLADVGEPDAWRLPGGDGVRPCDLWAIILNQTPDLDHPWSLVEAIAQTRHWGQGPLDLAKAELVPLP